MPGFFGSDFNSNQPSDDSLVKLGASVMRDIKSRLKTFLSVLFNLETGQLKDNIVTYTKLKDLDPNPSGTWQTVTVNSKGLVTGGEDPEPPAASVPQRVIYKFSTGFAADGSTISGTAATDDEGNAVRAYSFTVPEGVTRLSVQVQAAGGGGGSTLTSGAYGGGAGGGAEAFIDVNESDVFLVWVGQGGSGQVQGGADAQTGGMSKFEQDSSFKIQCAGGANGYETGGGSPGTAEIWGWVGQSAGGTNGSTTAGGRAPGYFAWGDGGGGSPTNGTSAPGLDGADGRVIVTYWTAGE